MCDILNDTSELGHARLGTTLSHSAILSNYHFALRVNKVTSNKSQAEKMKSINGIYVNEIRPNSYILEYI